MSATTEVFFQLSKVTDHDCGNYQIGEIDFVPLQDIRKYINQHGEFGYKELTDVCVRILTEARESIVEKRMESHGAAVQSN